MDLPIFDPGSGYKKYHNVLVSNQSKVLQSVDLQHFFFIYTHARNIAGA